ncbi:hypothetical protein O3P69_010701 [Scylla paramamosain]|uniref:Uncharacterized protein n=1 Tax=Scylla paramamosain TaxID=85552 RepID=A0AAW0TFZ0_SCYPA
MGQSEVSGNPRHAERVAGTTHTRIAPPPSTRSIKFGSTTCRPAPHLRPGCHCTLGYTNLIPLVLTLVSQSSPSSYMIQWASQWSRASLVEGGAGGRAWARAWEGRGWAGRGWCVRAAKTDLVGDTTHCSCRVESNGLASEAVRVRGDCCVGDGQWWWWWIAVMIVVELFRSSSSPRARQTTPLRR